MEGRRFHYVDGLARFISIVFNEGLDGIKMRIVARPMQRRPHPLIAHVRLNKIIKMKSNDKESHRKRK